MRRVSLLFISALFVCLMVAGCHRAADVYDSQHRPIRLADYHGKWVLVNYWAAWCVPCLRELPQLERLYQANRSKVVVLGVSFDAWSDAKINAFAKKWKLTFPMLSTFPKDKFGVKRIPTVPMTLLISPQGKLVTVLHGPQESRMLKKMLGGGLGGL